MGCSNGRFESPLEARRLLRCLIADTKLCNRLFLKMANEDQTVSQVTKADWQNVLPHNADEAFVALSWAQLFGKQPVQEFLDYNTFTNATPGGFEVFKSAKVWLTLQKGEDKAAPLTVNDCENACPGYGRELFAGMGGSLVMVFGMSDSITFEQFLNTKSAEVIWLTKVWLTLQKGEDKAAPLTVDDCENACPGFGKELFAGMGGSSVLVCGMEDSITFEQFLNMKSTESCRKLCPIADNVSRDEDGFSAAFEGLRRMTEDVEESVDVLASVDKF